MPDGHCTVLDVSLINTGMKVALSLLSNVIASKLTFAT